MKIFFLRCPDCKASIQDQDPEDGIGIVSASRGRQGDLRFPKGFPQSDKGKQLE